MTVCKPLGIMDPPQKVVPPNFHIMGLGETHQAISGIKVECLLVRADGGPFHGIFGLNHIEVARQRGSVCLFGEIDRIDRCAYQHSNAVCFLAQGLGHGGGGERYNQRKNNQPSEGSHEYLSQRFCPTHPTRYHWRKDSNTIVNRLQPSTEIPAKKRSLVKCGKSTFSAPLSSTKDGNSIQKTSLKNRYLN